jgi:hypothetical protein
MAIGLACDRGRGGNQARAEHLQEHHQDYIEMTSQVGLQHGIQTPAAGPSGLGTRPCQRDPAGGRNRVTPND